MELIASEGIASIRSFLNFVSLSDEPVIVTRNGQECLVAMTPDALDRLLFDVNLLNWSERSISDY